MIYSIKLNMPPVRKTINVTQSFDGNQIVDLRSSGVNLIYIPEFLTEGQSSQAFKDLLKSNVFEQHSYINRFKKRITPHRMTYAHVPSSRRYRLLGKDLERHERVAFTTIFNSFTEKIGSLSTVKILPNSSVSNAYRYNADDYIAPHTDDERFLVSKNNDMWDDSSVYTLTLLKAKDKPMKYHFANPFQEGSKIDGFELTPRHGSLIIQGSVLHTVIPIKGDGTIGRMSITLRSLHNQCSHSKGGSCDKISCPVNQGPSNYIYYSNKDAQPKPKKIKVKIKSVHN